MVIETRTVHIDDPTRDVPATVTAWLELPERAGRVPGVIVAHGCYGEGPEIDAWMSELRRMGYAALALDSFSGRDIREVCTGRQPISVLSRVHDVHRALALLARHPRIDPDRIALLGFSHGGWVALSASHAGFARLARVPGAPDFAAYLPFYPLGCNVRYLNEAQRVGGPIRIFHGAADDWTPAGPCRELAGRLRAAGYDVSMVEYDTAHHGFDATRAGVIVRLPDVVNLAHCVFVQQPDGGFITSDGRPAGPDAPCITRGATIGYNAVAHRRSIADVRAFLADAFGER
jgi:dienelactone hydrolase